MRLRDDNRRKGKEEQKAIGRTRRRGKQKSSDTRSRKEGKRRRKQ